MYLIATRDWHCPSNDKVYHEGSAYDVADARAKELLAEAHGALVPAGSTIEDVLGAMSTETETGIVAPDRRARGGMKRAGTSTRRGA